jgi:hypothetical protein
MSKKTVRRRALSVALASTAALTSPLLTRTAVAELPSNVPAVSPTTVGLGSFNIGARLANLRDLPWSL